MPQRAGPSSARHPVNLEMVCGRGEELPFTTFFSELAMPPTLLIHIFVIHQLLVVHLELFDIVKSSHLTDTYRDLLRARHWARS